MENMTDQREVSIVMPCLNEVCTIQACILEAQQALELAGVTGEIVVADNGSTDNSVQQALNAGARVVHVSERGYGHALRAGITAARGRHILMGDADGSYDFKALPHFLKALHDGADLVMGCRLPKGGGVIEPGAMPWKHRWIGNPILSGLGKLFFRAPVDDFHCGLRAFRREAILELDLKTTGMEYASEMVVKASLRGLRVAQVPITLRPDQRNRPPHLRSWRDGWRHLRFMLIYTPTWLFLIPGGAITFVNALAFAILLPGPVVMGRITFDVNTLLAVGAMLLLGFQILGLGVFIKTYAVTSGFLPGTDRWKKLPVSRPVEMGIVLGALIFLVGGGWLALAFWQWQQVGFGPMSSSASLRMVIPSVIALVLGGQAMFYGFALAVLGVHQRSCSTL